MTYKRIDYERLFEEPKELLGKAVSETDCMETVYPGTIIELDEKPILVYGVLPKEFSTRVVRSILPNVRFSKNRRLTQLKNQTEVKHTFDVNFGYNPPNRVFNTSAGACRFNEDNPNWYAELVKLGNCIAREHYAQLNPERYAHQMKFLEEKIAPHWRIKGTPFTQGVINDANALGYHYDRDNVPGGWSCMVYFKEGVQGGNLIVPALRLKFMCADRAFMLFDGQSLMHGVTPITKLNDKAYRYSIVYYARESMVGLGTLEEELAKSQDVEYRKHQKRMEEPKDV
jgi:hypothetical protein